MPLENNQDIKYFQFESLKRHGVIHGIFTRHGGVSPIPWESLNVGGLSGDSRANVIENRRRMFMTLGRPVETLYDVWQVHSADVVWTKTPRGLDNPHLKADAILTDSDQVTLFMRFADCVPIMLFDPNRWVIGLVHAGWQGTVEKTVRNTVCKMEEIYGTSPADIIAGIGPAISVDHYQVGADVIQKVKTAFGDKIEELLISDNGNTSFDLKAANRHTLESCGVQHIEVSDICTACHTEDWFSHRGENGKTGRFGALIAIDRSQSGG